jgi:hypothetical protein
MPVYPNGHDMLNRYLRYLRVFIGGEVVQPSSDVHCYATDYYYSCIRR